MSKSKHKWNETKKIKVVQLSEQNPKCYSTPSRSEIQPIRAVQCLDPTLTLKIALVPKIKSKLKIRNERNIENKSC